MELEKERAAWDGAVAAKEWALQVEQHTLTVHQEEWARSRAEAAAVRDYQDRQLVVVADGGEIRTTLHTLCREEASGLAALARGLLAADGAAEGAPQPLRLFVDREAAATHLVLDYLREGTAALEEFETREAARPTAGAVDKMSKAAAKRFVM